MAREYPLKKSRNVPVNKALNRNRTIYPNKGITRIVTKDTMKKPFIFLLFRNPGAIKR
jgi:hypothetical protein